MTTIYKKSKLKDSPAYDYFRFEFDVYPSPLELQNLLIDFHVVSSKRATNPILTFYINWLMRLDLQSLYTNSTYYRHRSSLRKLSIDVSFQPDLEKYPHASLKYYLNNQKSFSLNQQPT